VSEPAGEQLIADAVTRINALMTQLVRDVDAICDEVEAATGVRIIPPSVLAQVPRHTRPVLTITPE